MSADIQRAADSILSDSQQYETRVWLAADALYRDEFPHRRLIDAPARVRGTYLRKALKAVAALTDRFGPNQERTFVQAAAEYACHRDWAMRHADLRCYSVTRGME